MTNNGILNNILWKFAERISAQLVTLIVSVVLARLLDPTHYGLIAIVMIFVTLANLLVSEGFGSALIQKHNADDLDFSSVLMFNIFLSSVLYLILFFSAPSIAKFYGDGYSELVPVLRVLGLKILFAGISSIQQAYVSKKMIFKKFFMATFFGTVLSGIVGIWMALNGYGVWALVGQYLINSFVDMILLGISLKWWPGFRISFQRLKSLMSFGWRILFSSILITGFTELRGLIIGKLYTAEDLAYYDKGKKFPTLIVTNVSTSISAVLFPKMAQQQLVLEDVKRTTRESIRFSSFMMSPIMLGLAAVATPFISIVLTEKWLPSVPLLRIFCIFYLFHPIHSANMQAIKAIGRGDVYLRLEIVKKVIELAVLLLVMWISVDAIVISMTILSVAFTVVNIIPNKRLLNYGFKEQMRDILPSIGISSIMAIIVFSITYIQMGSFLTIIIQVLIGISIYIAFSIITKNQEFRNIVIIMKKLLRKQNT